MVKWVSFSGSLHWLAGGLDLGVGGISYVELLILHELWAGERLPLEKAHPRYLRPGRPISVSAVPFGPGIDIWRSCRFIGVLMRSLCLLPGGLRRFFPCSVGATHCRLRHIDWEKCGHGLTSRPLESASELFLDELSGLFRYPSRSGRALLNGDRGDEVLGLGVHMVSGSGPRRKRIRLNRKTPAHLAGFMVQSKPRVWKRLRHVGLSSVSVPDHKRRCGNLDDGRYILLRSGLGLGN